MSVIVKALALLVMVDGFVLHHPSSPPSASKVTFWNSKDTNHDIQQVFGSNAARFETALNYKEDSSQEPQDESWPTSSSAPTTSPNDDGFSSSSKNKSNKIVDTIKNKLSEYKDCRMNVRPRLTTMGRQRLEAEIRVLESLKYSNNGIVDLTNIWNSGGYGGAYNCYKSMMQIEMKMMTIQSVVDNLLPPPTRQQQQPNEAWKLVQNDLEQLIIEHNYMWTEPIFKLGMLYLNQGLCNDAYILFQYVLMYKPWHVGALDGMMNTCSNMNLYFENEYWKFKMIPPLLDENDGESRRRRTKWVNDMINVATEQLQMKDCYDHSLLLSLSQDSMRTSAIDGVVVDDVDSWQ